MSRYDSITGGRSLGGGGLSGHFGYQDEAGSIAQALRAQKLEYSRLSWQATQAANRGYISQEDLAAAKNTNDSNALQRLLGQGTADNNNSGGALETIGDVLNLPMEFMAAMSEATYKDPAIEIPLGDSISFLPPTLRLGFGLDAFSKAWSHKTTFSKMADEYDIFGSGKANAVGGFVADVLLDPTTYLTFGAKKGLQVSVQSVAKSGPLAARIAEKGLAKEGTLTLTRFGSAMYRLGAHAYAPILRKEMLAAGEQVGENLLTQPLARQWQERIMQYTAENFDKLREQHIKGLTQGWWSKAKMAMHPGGQGMQLAVRDALEKGAGKAGAGARALGAERIAKAMESKATNLGGMSAADMFQETATTLGKERTMYDLTKAQHLFAKIPYGGKLLDTFDKGWNVPDEVLEQGRLAQIATQTAYEKSATESIKYIQKLGLDEEDLDTVSRLIEARGQLLDYGSAGLPHFGPFRKEIEDAVTHISGKLDDILKREQAAGISIDGVKGYISHIGNPKIRDFYLEAIAKNGEESINAASRWTQARLIGSIAEGEELFGKGALKTNALEILLARERSSLQIIQQDKLFRDIVLKQSMPMAILHEMGAGKLPKGILRGWARRAGYGVHQISQVDQVYTAVGGHLHDLGFKWDPEDVAGSMTRNRDILKYLHRPNDDIERAIGEGLSGKYSKTGEAEAARLELPEAAKLHFVEHGTDLVRNRRPIPSTFRYSAEPLVGKDIRQGIRQGGKRSFPKGSPTADAEHALNMLNDPAHPLWDELLKDSIAGGKVKLDRVFGFLDGLDSYTKRWLDTSITGMVPDLEERIFSAIGRRFDGLPDKETLTFREDLAKKLVEYNQPFEYRKVIPQVPQTLVELARATRRAAGILTDETPVTPHIEGEVRKLYAKLGFTPPVIKQLNKVLFDKEAPTTLAEADRIIETLRPFATTAPKGSIAALKELPGRLGEKVVRYTIKTTRRVTGNIIPEMYDQEDLVHVAGGAPAPGSAGAETLAAGDGAELLDTLGGAASHTDRAVKTAAQEAYDSAKFAHEGKQSKWAFLKQKLDDLVPPDVQKRVSELKDTIGNQTLARKQALAKLKNTTGKAERKLVRAEVTAARKALNDARTELSKVPNLKDYEELAKEIKPARLEMKQAADEFRKASAEYDKHKAARVLEGGKGGMTTKPLPRSAGTTSDRIAALRKELVAAQNGKSPRSVEAIQAELDNLKTKLASGDLGREAAKFSRTPQEYEVYLPEGIANYLNELNAPNIDPTLGETAKDMLRLFDRIQGFYKTNLLLPFGAYHSRNAMQAATINVMRHGLAFISPKNNFEHATDWLTIMKYVLGKETDYFRILGEGRMTRIAEAVEKAGAHEIRLGNGSVMKVSDFVQEAQARGILHGAAHAEMIGEKSLWSRAASAVSGAGMGGMTGALAGGLYDQAAGNTDGQGLTYGSLLGAVGGAILGGRRLGYRTPAMEAAHLGGIPHMMTDKATALIQSRWAPFMHAGEVATELPFRLAMFLGGAKEHGVISEAAKEVYQHMNDYHGLSVFERRWLKRLVPFYSWTKTALKSTGLQLLEDPGKISALFKASRAWNTQYEGESLTPDFLDNKFTFLTTESGPDGKMRIAVPNLTMVEDAASIVSAVNFLPALTRSSTFQQEMEEVYKGIGSRMSFPLVTAMEAVSGKDSFTGKPLEYANADQWASAPGWLQSLVSYKPAIKGATRASVNPTMTWVLGEIPVSRFIQYMRQIESADPATRGQLDTWALAKDFLGASTMRVDPQSQRYFENKPRIEALKNLLDNVITRQLGTPPTSRRPRMRYLRR